MDQFKVLRENFSFYAAALKVLEVSA